MAITKNAFFTGLRCDFGGHLLAPPALCECQTANARDGANWRGAAHSMRASAQVTAFGAATIMIVAVSTRPSRQNRSTRSGMSVPLVQKQKLRLVNRIN